MLGKWNSILGAAFEVDKASVGPRKTIRSVRQLRGGSGPNDLASHRKGTRQVGQTMARIYVDIAAYCNITSQIFQTFTVTKFKVASRVKGTRNVLQASAISQARSAQSPT